MLNAVRQQIDPYIAAGNAVIDDVIDPRETRPTIVKALRMARNKHVEKPEANARGDAGMSRFEDPVIISCSISGVIANRDQCPAIPYTPEEYAAEARRAVDEGASQIHIHARKPDGTPSYEVEDFRAITEAILAEVGDVIVNYSTGAIGIPIEKRIEYLRALRPDVAALNMSSMNYAKYSRRRKDFVFKTVFENSFDTIIEFLTAMRELGIKPEHECFDAGHVANLDPLIDMGLLEEPLQISLVMGVTGGIRPTPRNVTLMSDQIPGGAEGPNQWQVIGISRDQWKLLGAGAGARRQRPRRGRGQPLPAERRDGEVQRRADRQGAPDGRRRRPAPGQRRRGARAAGGAEGVSAPAAERRPGPRPDPPAAGRLLLAAARRPRRRGAEGRGHRHGRLHPLGAALLRRARSSRASAPAPRSTSRSTAASARSGSTSRATPAARPSCAWSQSYDVVLDGFRPGVLDRLGVGYERMREANPAIVVCAITGYGQDGPNTQRAGHDMNYLGLVGLLGLSGEKDGPPVSSAGQIADVNGGLMAAIGVLAALHERRRSGEGQLVDVSMADGALSWLAMVAGRYFCDGEVPRRGEGQLSGGVALLPPLRGRRRLGQLRRPRAEVLGRLLQRRRPPRPDRGPVRGARLARPGARSPRSSAPAAARSGAPSTTSTTAASSRSSTSTRRSTPSWSARARWSSRSSSPGSARCASSAPR